MIKFILFSSKIFLTIIVTILLTSCNSKIDFNNGIDGNGSVTKEVRRVENNFEKVDISRGLNVTIEQSDSFFIEVEADENLQNHITTKVQNGILYITSDDNIDEATAKNILVRLPNLKSIEASSGSTVSSKGMIQGNDIRIETTSGSSNKLNLEYDNITCESTSGSTLNITGKALKFSTVSSSGSSIEAKNLLANDVISQASSGSTTEVHPLISLNAEASSGGLITFNSSPKTIIKNESSGGSVTKE
ncbi:head GIN domain-containing protein [Flavobacterium sp. j3]|uniref:Head GIN domain-containing protein n=1 Tax=Flavobacterium aureirubrum TaxID=3133147 RepID=A0ABU9N319_9FLAO